MPQARMQSATPLVGPPSREGRADLPTSFVQLWKDF